jgi:ketosteroid isomerase-like protein
VAKRRFDEVTRELDAAATSGTLRDKPSAQHILSIREQIDAIARGDLDGALANAHPAIEFEIFAPPEFPWVRRASGVEALRLAIAQNFASVSEQTPTIHNVVTESDVVVLFGEERGVIRGSGQRYHMQFVHRFTFADGRLKSIRIVAAKAA